MGIVSLKSRFSACSRRRCRRPGFGPTPEVLCAVTFRAATKTIRPQADAEAFAFRFGGFDYFSFFYTGGLMTVEKLGSRVRKYREERNITREELAKAANLSVEFITSLEDNNIYPSIGPAAGGAPPQPHRDRPHGTPPPGVPGGGYTARGPGRGASAHGGSGFWRSPPVPPLRRQ